MWVSHHPLNNSLVVFVHGIFGNRWGTWKGIPDFIQRSFPEDPRLRSYDMYLFQYDTRVLFQPPLWPYVVKELRQFLESVGNKYRTTVLIGHSQGGIVVKLCVLDFLRNGEGEGLTVDLVITLGTPHRGRAALNPLYWLQRIPLLGGMVPLQQLGQLASCSPNIHALRQHWNGMYISRDSSAPTQFRRNIRSIAATGAYDKFVTTKSAIGFGVDVPYYVSRAHAGLAKIHTPADRLADMLVEQLQQHRDPNDIRLRMREILAQPAEFEQYVREHSDKVAEQVALSRPLLRLGPGAGIEIKAASLLADFLIEFPKRPLRGLTFEQALTTYVQRRLDEGV